MPFDPQEVAVAIAERLRAVSAYPDAVLADGPLAYWRLSGLLDEVGGFHLADTGATPFVAGQVGDAADFDGATQYLSTSSFTPALTGNVTMEAWIRPDAVGSFDRRFLNKGGSGFDWRVYIQATGRIAFLFTDPTPVNRSVGGTTVLQPGQWYHVVGTWDGTSLLVYLNGVLEGTAAPGAVAPRDTGDQVRIGDGMASGDNFDGLVDEVAIYDKVLSAERVAEHHRLGREGFLRARAGLGDTANPPEAHVFLTPPVEYDLTNSRGVDRCTFRVRLFVSKSSGSERAQEALSPYIAGKGARSVKQAIDRAVPTPNTILGDIACRVAAVDQLGTVTAGGVEYIGCDFVVETWG